MVAIKSLCAFEHCNKIINDFQKEWIEKSGLEVELISLIAMHEVLESETVIHKIRR